MKYLSIVFALAAPALMGGIQTSHRQAEAPRNPVQESAATLSPDAPNQTILLVSLDDGSVIMQNINTSADICFKSNSDSATTCLTQGAPIIDPVTNRVIGFEMIEDQIDLVGKAD